MIKLAALWKKEGPKGPFLAGKLGDASILIFPNNKKTQANHPDYNVFIVESKPREQAQKPKPTNFAPKSQSQAGGDLPLDLWDRADGSDPGF